MASKVAPLVWINGFPGAGKLTVATALAELDKTVIVIDNHRLIDPVEAKFPRSHPDYQRERHLYRQKVFEEHVCNPATLSRTVVFTDFQSTNELGSATAVEYLGAANRAGRPFFPVYLICDIDTNLERVANPDRVNSGTGKLTDIELLKVLHSTYELFRFSCPGLTVDSTSTSPEATATQILAFVNNSSSDYEGSIAKE